MSSGEINVYPNIKRTVSIVKLSVRPMEIELFRYIRIVVVFMDENDRPFDSAVHTIEGDDYKAWASDDNYIFDWVKRYYKLGPYAV